MEVFDCISSTIGVLTPHVLSEWMVEVCAGEIMYGVCVIQDMMFGIRFCLCFKLLLGDILESCSCLIMWCSGWVLFYLCGNPV